MLSKQKNSFFKPLHWLLTHSTDVPRFLRHSAPQVIIFKGLLDQQMSRPTRLPMCCHPGPDRWQFLCRTSSFLLSFSSAIPSRKWFWIARRKACSWKEVEGKWTKSIYMPTLGLLSLLECSGPTGEWIHSIPLGCRNGQRTFPMQQYPWKTFTWQTETTLGLMSPLMSIWSHVRANASSSRHHLNLQNMV